MRALIILILGFIVLSTSCPENGGATNSRSIFGRPWQNDQQPSDSKPINSWKTLVPLKSTRADVERLFGPPSLEIASTYSYRFDNESVMFRYAKGNCSADDYGWNVPPDAIVEIEIVPQTTRSVAESGFDLVRFRRTTTDHPKLVIYENLEDGVTLRTKRIGAVEEAVVSIQLVGSSRDIALACPSPKKPD